MIVLLSAVIEYILLFSRVRNGGHSTACGGILSHKSHGHFLFGSCCGFQWICYLRYECIFKDIYFHFNQISYQVVGQNNFPPGFKESRYCKPRDWQLKSLESVHTWFLSFRWHNDLKERTKETETITPQDKSCTALPSRFIDDIHPCPSTKKRPLIALNLSKGNQWQSSLLLKARQTLCDFSHEFAMSYTLTTTFTYRHLH